MKKIALSFLMIVLCFGYATAQTVNMPSFSGVMFGDYFYYMSAHDGSLRDFNGFDLRRIDFAADYTISNTFSSEFRLEGDGTPNSLTPGGKFGVMVKDAWLRWQNIFQGSDLYFGVSPTPAFTVSENAWGHRFLEKTILDYNGIVPARDLGVDLRGNITGDGSLKYWVKLGNNSSNGPEFDKYKRVYAMFEVNPNPQFLFTIYADYAAAPLIFDPVDGISKSNDRFVASLFFNYNNGNDFSLGVEPFINLIQNNYAPTPISPLENQTADGISIWAWGSISPMVRLVGRFDYFDPNTDATLDNQGLILFGVDLLVDPHVILTPNIEIRTYDAPPINGGDGSDVIPRVTFFWQF